MGVFCLSFLVFSADPKNISVVLLATSYFLSDSYGSILFKDEK